MIVDLHFGKNKEFTLSHNRMTMKAKDFFKDYKSKRLTK